jgi:hypothetical protein
MMSELSFQSRTAVSCVRDKLQLGSPPVTPDRSNGGRAESNAQNPGFWIKSRMTE